MDGTTDACVERAKTDDETGKIQQTITTLGLGDIHRIVGEPNCRPDVAFQGVTVLSVSYILAWCRTILRGYHYNLES